MDTPTRVWRYGSAVAACAAALLTLPIAAHATQARAADIILHAARGDVNGDGTQDLAVLTLPPSRVNLADWNDDQALAACGIEG